MRGRSYVEYYIYGPEDYKHGIEFAPAIVHSIIERAPFVSDEMIEKL